MPFSIFRSISGRNTRPRSAGETAFAGRAEQNVFKTGMRQGYIVVSAGNLRRRARPLGRIVASAKKFRQRPPHKFFVFFCKLFVFLKIKKLFFLDLCITYTLQFN
jgi:hypothetical protein